MNKRILKYWYVYIVVILIASIFSCYLVDFINAPRKEETISLFVACYEDNYKELESKIYDSLDYDYLREVRVRTAKLNDSRFDKTYSTIGHSNSDIIIIPSEKMKDEIIARYYDKFSSNIMNRYFKDISDTYTINNNIYGIKVHSKDVESNSLIKWNKNEIDHDYYAFIKKNIIHTDISRGGTYDTAYRIIENIYDEVI